MYILKKCSCGRELQFEEIESTFGIEPNSEYVGYCLHCKSRWTLVNTTESYKESLVNEIIEPEFGEYIDDNGDWHYQDGSLMEF